MHEFEIKLQVPPDRRAALDAELARSPAARRTHLQASYFDTPDRDLAHAGIALRLRKEGRLWIQTLKAAGPDALTRFEHNVPVVGRGSVAIDPARHAGTPVGDRLLQLLAEKGPLQEVYRSDVWRRSRTTRSRGASLELALDTGHLQGGDRRAPVCEFEIELLAGDQVAVLAAARRWIAKYRLWLDVRSKAERGDRLSRGVIDVPARKAKALKLDEGRSLMQAWRAVLASTLEHILPNACELADGLEQGEHRAEQVHQVRVGLRRLRSALRLFRGWPGIPEASAVNEAAAQLFRRLGATRDLDVLMATVVPALKEAGAPALQLPQAEEQEVPAQVLREVATQMLWLDLLGWIHADAGQAGTSAGPAGRVPAAPHAEPRQAAPAQPESNSVAAKVPPLRELAAKRLRGWHRNIVGRRDDFMQMPDTERHTLRKRIKRLRYGLDFLGSLFPRRRVKRYLAALSEAQEVFGEYNDLCMAEGLLAQGDDPGAWFARGWLAARREEMLLKCQSALVALADAPKFWK